MGQLGRFFTMIKDWRWASLTVLVLFACLGGGLWQGKHIALERLNAIFDQSTPFILEKFIEAKKKEYQGGNFKKLLGHLAGLKL